MSSEPTEDTIRECIGFLIDYENGVIGARETVLQIFAALSKEPPRPVVEFNAESASDALRMTRNVRAIEAEFEQRIVRAVEDAQRRNRLR